MIKIKICTKCKIEKEIDDFHKDKNHKDGHSYICKQCKRGYWKKYSKENKEKLNKQCKKYREKNKDKRNKQSKKWREKNKDYIEKKRKENKEYYKQYKKIYRKEKREHINKLAREYNKKPNRNLHMRITNRVYKMLKSNKEYKSWKEFLDYSLKDLKNHLENRFKKGMSWDNMNEWCIDHIIPVNSFNFSSPDDKEFKLCWDLNNLQPLWKKENEKKWSKIDYYSEKELKDFNVLEIYKKINGGGRR
ncbi:MAG TPA: hypothetical protein VMZ91_02880 [Candidatus Paceibacterota bacterium]|nr:hypothetical protein [Candidatus Paceibacterota bacterium]